jgi:hypothetical protein
MKQRSNDETVHVLHLLMSKFDNCRQVQGPCGETQRNSDDGPGVVGEKPWPAGDDESVCNCISTGSEVQLLVDIKVNKKVLGLLPKRDTTETEINMTEDRLCDVDIEKLAEALAVDIAVRIVHLDANMIGHAGYLALAKALTVNTVRTVHLNSNIIGVVECVAWLKS